MPLKSKVTQILIAYVSTPTVHVVVLGLDQSSRSSEIVVSTHLSSTKVNHINYK